MSAWIAETLIATTVLMALVLLLRRPVAHFLGAGATYMLWILPLARLALPPLPRDVAPAMPLQSAVDHVGLASVLIQPATTFASDSASALPWVEIAAGIWIMGVVAFLLFHAVGYARFHRLMLANAQLRSHQGRIRIIATPQATSPLAFGVLRPIIALPMDFDTRFDAEEQALAIAHECAHHRRGDLLANMIALAMMALHWCNPIAWMAWRAFRADQELACDARIIADHGQDMAHAYGRAILKAASGPRFAAVCHLTRLDTLKGRLKMLSTHADSLHRISWGMAAVALVTLAGLALTASGSRAAREMAAITDTVDNVDMARLTNLIAETPAKPMVVRNAMMEPPVTPQTPAAPTQAEWPTVPASPLTVTPPTPPSPPAPAADMVPPMPPVPPVRVMRENGRIMVAHADGRTDIHTVPTAADIHRMVPVVDVKNGCDGNEIVSNRTTTLADGRQSIRVRICQTAIERQRAQAAADRSAALADRQQAITDIAAARAEMARDRSIPAEARAEALRNMDEAIANMRAGHD